MDILKEAAQVATRGEVKSAIVGTLHDLMMDIDNTADHLIYSLPRETYVACSLCVGAMDVWTDYLEDGIISINDILRFVSEALTEEMHTPGPICTTCLRVARCGTCPECRKSICRSCLIEHLQSHG